MSRPRMPRAALSVCLMVLSCATSQDEVERRATAQLRAARNRYPSDTGLWDTEPLRSFLRDLLGSRFPVFVENMQVACPVTEESGVLFVTGTRLEGGADHAAIILADVSAGAIRVSLWEGAGWEDFSRSRFESRVPDEAQGFLNRYIGVDAHNH